MQFVRFTADNNSEHKGLLENGEIKLIYGSFLQNYTVTDVAYAASDVHLLAPVLPKNILCAPLTAMQGYIKAASSIAGAKPAGSSVAELHLPNGVELSCVPRVAYVVKNKDQHKDYGISVLGATLMLDFIAADDALTGAFRNFTVIGPAIDTDFTSERVLRFMRNDTLAHAGAYRFDPQTLRMMAREPSSNVDGIAFEAGDIIAAVAAAPVSCARGDKFSLGDGKGRIEATIA